jgi:hypothetical protein
MIKIEEILQMIDVAEHQHDKGLIDNANSISGIASAYALASIAKSLEKLSGCVEQVYNHGDRFMVRTSKEGEP